MLSPCQKSLRGACCAQPASTSMGSSRLFIKQLPVERAVPGSLGCCHIPMLHMLAAMGYHSGVLQLEC